MSKQPYWLDKSGKPVWHLVAFEIFLILGAFSPMALDSDKPAWVNWLLLALLLAVAGKVGHLVWQSRRKTC